MKHKTNPEEFEQRKAQMAAESDKMDQRLAKKPNLRAFVTGSHKASPKAMKKLQ